MEPATTFETHAELRARMRGELLEPSNAGYDEARQIHNAMHDRRPALIARCARGGRAGSDRLGDSRQLKPHHVGEA